MFKWKDFYSEAKERSTDVFRDKTVFQKYLSLMLSEHESLQEALRYLKEDFNVHRAKGKDLDIIGELVGQKRTLFDSNLLDYFVFEGVISGEGFGDVNDPDVGGLFYDLRQPEQGSVTLNDEQYRLFIKAKMLKNNLNPTPPNLITFLNFVFGDKSYRIEDGGGVCTVFFKGRWPSFERNLLTYYTTEDGYIDYFVPRPIGVELRFEEETL